VNPPLFLDHPFLFPVFFGKTAPFFCETLSFNLGILGSGFGAGCRVCRLQPRGFLSQTPQFIEAFAPPAPGFDPATVFCVVFFSYWLFFHGFGPSPSWGAPFGFVIRCFPQKPPLFPRNPSLKILPLSRRSKIPRFLSP